jgi:ParB/RepB/Spo0J family partition protein
MATTEELVRLPLAAVAAGDNPRKTFGESALSDLAASIKALGQQAPVIVRPHPTRPDVYQLVDGERRWRACHEAGVETVLCLVRELDDRSALEVALVANSARSDVHPLEESDALIRLIGMGSDVEDMRGRMNRGEQWVRDRLALGKLVPELRARLAAGDMWLRSAVILAHIPPGRQVDIAVNNRAWPMSVKEAMRRAAGDTPRPLATALWSLSDPAAGGRGACDGCIYRTDTQPELLGEEATKAKCMDAACWSAKGEAFLAARAAQGATIIRNEFPAYDTPTLDTPAWLLDRALERVGLPTPEGIRQEDETSTRPDTWAARLPEARVTYVVTPHGDIRPCLTRAAMADALRGRGLPEVAAIIDPAARDEGLEAEGSEAASGEAQGPGRRGRRAPGGHR